MFMYHLYDPVSLLQRKERLCVGGITIGKKRWGNGYDWLYHYTI